MSDSKKHPKRRLRFYDLLQLIPSIINLASNVTTLIKLQVNLIGKNIYIVFVLGIIFSCIFTATWLCILAFLFIYLKVLGWSLILSMLFIILLNVILLLMIGLAISKITKTLLPSVNT